MSLEVRGFSQHNQIIILNTPKYSDPNMVLTGTDLAMYHEKKAQLDAIYAAASAT
ncbi:hypothetical protein QQX98_006339 [Neonectria punicea]|uniref:Uncharacterized protein n=1 Tax=Neonectria punicea TaxID=979145 RepID=A0ABR1H152_9HYPO